MLLRRNITRRARVALGSGAAIAAMVLSAIGEIGALGAWIHAGRVQRRKRHHDRGRRVRLRQDGWQCGHAHRDDVVRHQVRPAVGLSTPRPRPRRRHRSRAGLSRSPRAAGDGIQTVTATASPNFNANPNCTGQSQNPQSASYILDNNGPHSHRRPAGAQHRRLRNSTDVNIEWTALDAGAGVAGPHPRLRRGRGQHRSA